MTRPDKLTPENILEYIETHKDANNGVGETEFLELYHDRSKTKLDIAHRTGRGRNTINRWIDLVEIRLDADKNKTL